MLFKILSISHGWFMVDFNRQFILTNSDFMGCDAPALFLNALGDLLDGKVSEQWLCWQDEPGAYILRLERDCERLIIEIFDAIRDSDSLEYCGACLEKDIGNRVYKGEDKIKPFVKTVITEFGLYENGNGKQLYQSHWGAFPHKQYDRLKKSIRSLHMK